FLDACGKGFDCSLEKIALRQYWEHRIATGRVEQRGQDRDAVTECLVESIHLEHGRVPKLRPNSVEDAMPGLVCDDVGTRPREKRLASPEKWKKLKLARL